MAHEPVERTSKKLKWQAAVAVDRDDSEAGSGGDATREPQAGPVPESTTVSRPGVTVHAATDTREPHRTIRALQEEIQRMVDAQSLAKIGVWTWSAATGECEASDLMLELMNLTPGAERLNVGHLEKTVDRPSLRRLNQFRADIARRDRRTAEVELHVRRGPDTSTYVSVIGTAIRDSSGRVTGAYGTAQDITRRRLSERALAETETDLRHLMDSTNVIPWRTNFPEGRFIYVGRNAERILGHPLEDWFEPDFPRRIVHPDDFDRLERIWRKNLIEGGDEFSIQYRCVGRDGQIVWVNNAANVYYSGGRVAGTRGVITDITEQRRSEQERDALTRSLDSANKRLRLLATRDPLTGIFNRRGIQTKLTELIRPQLERGESATAVVIDCDSFKAINDQYGHAMGDLVLSELSQRLESNVRGRDIVGRVGGDEFMLLLPGLCEDDVEPILQRVRVAITKHPFFLASEPVMMTVSMGVVELRSTNCTIEEVLSRGRLGLAKCKQATGNKIAWASGIRTSSAITAERLLDIAERGLRTFWQPIVDLSSGGTIAFEALIRGPSGDLEPPDQLFTHAGALNVLTSVDLNAFRRCLRSVHLLPAGTRLHVNIMPSTLLALGPAGIADLLAHDAERLCVELSEQQYVGDRSFLRECMDALRSLGAAVAIDDVGTGRGSLDSVLLLEPDLVKIDKSMVAGIATHARVRRNLSRLAAMTRAFELEAIVEGVETAVQAQIVTELGFRFAQGYYWAHPCRPSTFLTQPDTQSEP